LPCGNVDPLGITGTPVYDGSSGILYVAAELAGPLRHTLYAIDAVTGKVLWHRPLDVPGMDPRVQQERGALTLSNGTVYVPLGGLYGDCGDYHGWVIGYHTTGTGPLVYQTQDTKAGIWSPPGLTVTPSGQLLASVGNSGHTSASQGYDHSDAILSLSPTLKLTDYFSPTTWAEDNAGDLDLSSMSPTYIPGGKVFIAGKRGVAYLTSATQLGHVGGQLSTLNGCASYGGTAYYKGVVFAPCSDGLAAIAISGNHMKVLWKAPGNITGSPIYGGGAVWTLDQGAGVVYGLDRATGKVLRKLRVGQTSRFATMAMLHGYLHVPTMTGVVAIRTG
jgi:outer membrane protein assembly factor BamB